MNERYLEARSVALGLIEGAALPPAKSYEDMQLGQRAEAGSELFSKTFETPPEVIVRRSVLSLFEEYDDDYDNVQTLYQAASGLISQGKSQELAGFLQQYPPVEWLNCIFLEDEDIDSFALLLEKTDDQSRAILLVAISDDLRRLVSFKGLFQAVLKKWKFAADGDSVDEQDDIAEVADGVDIANSTEGAEEV